jgi:hypothetical protein
MTATCACGQATISVNALATMHGVCHCPNCKRRTGSAFGISELESLLFTPARHAKTRTNVVANARNSYGYCCALRLAAARFEAPLGRARKTLKLSAYFDKTAVNEFTGQTQIYAFHHAAQKHNQKRHFCPQCGTTLFWYLTVLPEKIGIAGGCVADEALPEPTYAVTDCKREAWVSLPGHWQVHPN